MLFELLIQELANSSREVSKGLALGKRFIDEGKVGVYLGPPDPTDRVGEPLKCQASGLRAIHSGNLHSSIQFAVQTYCELLRLTVRVAFLPDPPQCSDRTPNINDVTATSAVPPTKATVPPSTAGKER